MKKIIKIWLLVVVVVATLSILSCESQGKETSFNSISVNEAFVLLQDNTDIQLVDVRTAEEYERVHIEGATLISISSLPGMIDSLNRASPILVYCAVGGRSYVAGKYLQSEGFSMVYNMSGGIKEWYEKRFPVKFGE